MSTTPTTFGTIEHTADGYIARTPAGNRLRGLFGSWRLAFDALAVVSIAEQQGGKR